MICFAIIASCILGVVIGFILGSDSQSHRCNVFIEDNNKNDEYEEKEKTTNWKFTNLSDSIEKMEEYEKEHPNKKSMISSCMLKWMAGWMNYEEKLVREGHSPSSHETKPRISDIF